MSEQIRIDEEQCRKLARCLDRVEVRPDEFVVQVTDAESRRREANLWFFLIAICQSTRTLQGTIDGKWLRGWDYMVRAARRNMDSDPEWYSAKHLIHVTRDELRAGFSDDGLPQHTTLDRIDERLDQWQEAARFLLESYEGDIMQLYRAAVRRLRGGNGILARLTACGPYSDPVEKKSFLLIMFCHRCGAWEIADLEHLRVATDYHVMRIALRSGMIRVLDLDLAEKLRSRTPVSAEIDNAIREATRDACELVTRMSAHDVFAVDNILWMMGRNCCFYDYDPICGDHICWRRDQCSMLRSIDYDCPGLCLFDGACLGSRQPGYRAYWETNLYTAFY